MTALSPRLHSLGLLAKGAWHVLFHGETIGLVRSGQGPDSARLESIAAEPKEDSILFGIYGRVARALNVSPLHVKEVASGAARSDRVSDALLCEVGWLNKKLWQRELAAIRAKLAQHENKRGM